MSVDLGTLIESLKRETSPPGTNLFPAAQDEEWLGHLEDAFWEGRLNGMFAGYTEENGSVTPISEGSDDLGRDLQQLIVLYAGYRIVINSLRNLRTSFRAEVSGGTSYEVQQSATVMRDVLKALKEKIDPIVKRLKASGNAGILVMDAVIQRSYGEWSGQQWWLR